MSSLVLQAARAQSAPAIGSVSARDEDLERALARLVRRLRVAIVHAGSSAAPDAVLYRSVNTRSWKSYESVARDIAAALGRLGCREVSVVPEDMNLPARLGQARAHLAWLNTAGVQGRACAAHAASTLELLGLPFVGHDPLNAAILDTKPVFKRQAQAMGLPTAPFTLVDPRALPFAPSQDEGFRAAFPTGRGPFVVKPANGRASQHVHFVEDQVRLREAVEAVAEATRNTVLVERYLPGAEYCIAVCGGVIARDGRLTRCDEPFAFSAIERRLDEDERIFTSMDQKPITGARARLLDPVDDAEVRERLIALARRVWRAFGLETLVRIDVRADETGALHLLEANPKPDLAAPRADATSLVAMGLPMEGMSYDDLVLSLLAQRIDEARRGPVRPEALLRLM